MTQRYLNLSKVRLLAMSYKTRSLVRYGYCISIAITPVTLPMVMRL